MPVSLLIIDDEQDMLQLLRRSLEPELDCTVTTANSGEDALKALSAKRFDLILADIKMPGMNGIEFLELVKRDVPDQTVIMMTAFGHIEMAVQAMKSGAYDFITKPFEHDALLLRIEKALERNSLLKENLRLQRECRDQDVFHDIVGASRSMQAVFDTIRTVAQTDLTVLITGESGTGKNLTARAIHALSARRQGPFVTVNCPTIPEQILESELFGYKKGAFTHATQNKTGMFQEGHGGSVFLDEIGDISPSIQTKLLKVIQEKEFKPLGDTATVQVDVRIIASTNRNLRAKIERREFREDLFYRLNVLPIVLPPLRERVEDIPLIANHLLAKHCDKLQRPLKAIAPELMSLLSVHPWEGNVRELENVIIRGILYTAGDVITPRDAGFETAGTSQAPTAPAAAFGGRTYKAVKEEVLKRFNTDYIGDLLSQNEGNVTRAAKRCGLERQALQQIMRRYGIQAEDYRK